MKTKKAYIAPQMTVESYEGEIGYAVSLTLINNDLQSTEWDTNNQERWSYSSDNYFGHDNNGSDPVWSWQ